MDTNGPAASLMTTDDDMTKLNGDVMTEMYDALADGDVIMSSADRGRSQPAAPVNGECVTTSDSNSLLRGVIERLVRSYSYAKCLYFSELDVTAIPSKAPNTQYQYQLPIPDHRCVMKH